MATEGHMCVAAEGFAPPRDSNAEESRDERGDRRVQSSHDRSRPGRAERETRSVELRTAEQRRREREREIQHQH